MHSARHKASAIGKYDELSVATRQPQDAAVGREGLTKYLQRLHEFNLIGEKALGNLGMGNTSLRTSLDHAANQVVLQSED
jgi:hypothetical protein